jgi:hypothetical protein
MHAFKCDAADDGMLEIRTQRTGKLTVSLPVLFAFQFSFRLNSVWQFSSGSFVLRNATSPVCVDDLHLSKTD